MYNEVANKVVSILENHYDVPAEVRNVVKNNDTELCGITVGDTVVRPTVYINQMVDDGLDAYQIAETILDKVSDATIGNDEQVAISSLFECYENVAPKIRARICNLANNAARLANVPYRTVYDDLAVYAVVIIGINDGEGTAMINESLLKMWGKNADEILDMAIAQTCEDTDRTLLVEHPFSIVTNKSKVGGAVQLMDKEFMERFGDDYYIIPSSIHEVLVVRGEEGMTVEKMLDSLQTMIQEVNAECVSAEEVLSDHAYHIVNGEYVATAA